MIIINLLNDIVDIIKNDSRHNVKIVIDGTGVAIYLDDDPDESYEEKYVIPIRYETLEECCHIPYGEYVECMENSDIGIDKEEVSLIYVIMDYLENNKIEINQLCRQLQIGLREIGDKKDDVIYS